MDQQASALTQIAKATVNNSKAMERIAEASHKQVRSIICSYNKTVTDLSICRRYLEKKKMYDES